MSDSYLLGVDVGSSEVRCGLVDLQGSLVRLATAPLVIYSPLPSYYQQSSNQIWQAVVQVIKEVTESIDVEKIKGIGCDATCSLVLVPCDPEHNLHVCPQGEGDVIMWMDHRAEHEAEVINRTGHQLLSYLGGKVSLEMQLPKLMWLKQNMPQVFQQTRHFFDLPDFLTWKLTGSLTRSKCSLVCKWMYQGSPEAEQYGWNENFLRSLGLQDLCENNFSKIGEKVATPGEVVGYLSNTSAIELGLKAGVPVAASLIDAHAGTLGILGTQIPKPFTAPLTSRLGMICGTSSCLMLLSEKPALVKGVWGPYYDAVLKTMWLSEGGQSSAGQLVDHIVASHPCKLNSSTPSAVSKDLEEILNKMSTTNNHPLQLLTHSLHLYPDFRGNRSPIADPNLRGMVSGLDLNSDKEQLAIIYLSTLQALSYSARQTVERLETEGLGPIKCLILCGGMSKNRLYLRTLAGAVNRPILVPEAKHSVILGAAMLGATAAGLYSTLSESMQAMASSGYMILEPNRDILRYHDKKYQVYLKMQSDQIAYRDIMSDLK